MSAVLTGNRPETSTYIAPWSGHPDAAGNPRGLHFRGCRGAFRARAARRSDGSIVVFYVFVLTLWILCRMRLLYARGPGTPDIRM